eukprot:tig00020675_g12695.t1
MDKATASGPAADAGALPPVRVLSLDGGGLRGICLLKMLSYIEKRAKKPIAELFDLIVGTSAGGITALGLTCKDKDGKYVGDVEKHIQMLYDRGHKVFPRPRSRAQRLLRQLRGGSVYGEKGVHGFMKGLFGTDLKLSDCVTDVLVVSYNLEQREPHYFKSRRAKEFPDTHDHTLYDVGRATTAAPGFLPPHKIKMPLVYRQRGYSTFVDGGMVANNPALLGWFEASKLYPGREIVVVSLGTGNCDTPYHHDAVSKWSLLKWIHPMLDCIMDGSSDMTNQMMDSILRDNFYRFSPMLPDGMDSFADARHTTLDLWARSTEKQARIHLFISRKGSMLLASADLLARLASGTGDRCAASRCEDEPVASPDDQLDIDIRLPDAGAALGPSRAGACRVAPSLSGDDLIMKAEGPTPVKLKELERRAPELAAAVPVVAVGEDQLEIEDLEAAALLVGAGPR